MTDTNHNSRLNIGLFLAVNAWINGNRIAVSGDDTYTYRDLFVGADLAGFDFTRAYLPKARFTRADLRGACFENAYLEGAAFDHADAIRVNFQCANLQYAVFTNGRVRRADFRGADLRWSCFYSCGVVTADFRRAQLKGIDFNYCDLTHCEFEGATLLNFELAPLRAMVASANRGDYTFFLFQLEDGTFCVRAGCRWLSIPAYRAHIKREYPRTYKAQKTRDILNYFAAVARGITA